MHYFDLLFGEISKRKMVGVASLKNAFPWEIIGLMHANERGNKILGKKRRIFNALKSRGKYSLTIYRGKIPKIHIGGSAKAKYRQIYGKESKVEDFAELHGICASAGKAIGRARIVTKAIEGKGMQKGDILIAPATDPEHVIAMKKAAAIITDEGGITSHAAIVSRELGIPCLVGTKFATKAFKNGEMVEVDANHGVIRVCLTNQS